MTIHRPEAEQLVIGGLLLDPSRIDEVADLITAKDFYNADYRLIFSAMIEIMESGEFPEWQLLADCLTQHFHQPGKEWFPIIAELVKNAPSSTNVHLYAAMVAEDHRRRQLLIAGNKIQGLALDRELDLEQRINKSHSLIEGIETERTGEGPVCAAEKLREFVNHLDACARAGEGITGLKTGFSNVDHRLGGLKEGGLTVIAARPAMGKTSFALNLAKNISIDQGKPVLFFTVEMDANELIGRITANVGSIQYSRVQSAKLDDQDWANMASSVTAINESSLIVDESSSLHVQEIIARSRRQHRRTPLGLIVVDHIGLVDAEGETETIRIGKVSRGLKGLAKKLNVPVIALSQLSRNCEQRPNKRPVLSDLRHSGDIEQDADNVAFIYRDEYYNSDSRQPGIAELIWRKVRAGQIGTDYFKAILHFHRFVEQEGEVVPFTDSSPNRKRSR